ncbi:hypothetical protein AB7200_05945, partial [Providencia alcalifaciens]
ASKLIPMSIHKYVIRVSERSQHRYSMGYDGITLNNSCCSKAASKLIPMSIHKYVIRVSERSQHRYSTKYDG